MRMKLLLTLLGFCLLSFCGSVMIRAHRPLPVLHSVFDAAPSAPLPAFQERWLLNDPEAGTAFSGPRHFDPAKAARRRETGIYLTVFGSIALAGAALLVKEGNEQSEQSRRTDNSKAAGMGQYMLAAVLGMAGLGMFIPGVVLLIYYSTRKHRWY